MFKNSFYLLFFYGLFACQQNTNTDIPISSFKIMEDTSRFMTLTDFEEFEAVLATEKGNVLLVNIWATWCKPCVHEMPGLEKLHQNYQGKGVKVVTLSLDEVAKADSLVVPYWDSMHFSMDNYLIATPDQGSFVNKIDPLWIGLLPTSFIFNPEGKKIETVTGALSYNSFEKKVLKVLNEVN